MGTREAGFWFGEYGTLSGAPAIASIVAATSARVLLLPAAEFARIVAAERATSGCSPPC